MTTLPQKESPQQPASQSTGAPASRSSQDQYLHCNHLDQGALVERLSIVYGDMAADHLALKGRQLHFSCSYQFLKIAESLTYKAVLFFVYNELIFHTCHPPGVVRVSLSSPGETFPTSSGGGGLPLPPLGNGTCQLVHAYYTCCVVFCLLSTIIVFQLNDFRCIFRYMLLPDRSRKSNRYHLLLDEHRREDRFQFGE